MINGWKITNYADYFPETVDISAENPATIMDAAYRDLNLVCIRYCSEEGYYIDFTAEWKEDHYEVSQGKEVYYNLTYSLTLSSETEIIDGLNRWRADNTKEESSEEVKEVINTTYFSALLNCAFYEQEKELTME